MKRTFARAVVLVGSCVLFCTPAGAGEPYPFETRPREIKKEVWLKVDFEGELPQGARLGENAKIEANRGAANSKGLVSSKKGIIAKFPIFRPDVGISRFDLTLDCGGTGFAYFVARLNAYNRQGKNFKSVTISGDWGITPGARTWRTRTVDLEFEDIYAVELELEQTSESGTIQIDNIVLERHVTSVVRGRIARSQLTLALQAEGAEVSDVGGVWIAHTKDRTSYFDFGPIKENKRYVRSQWEQRLHVGTTYKTTRGKLPAFVLGVSARQAAFEAAAAKKKQSLAQMYEFFLDDVAKHGFNTVWVDVTKDLEKFDQLAARRGISVILRDPNWSNLEKWVAKPDGPMPAEFKKTAAANFARYGKLKSVIGYHMNRPLSSRYQPMLAQARKHLGSLNPKIQLLAEESGVYTNEDYETPYPHVGIQVAGHHHYAGRPWIQPSYLYHPNYWPLGIGEGYYRLIFNGFHVKRMPCLWSVPCSREFRKKSIDMQKDRVIPETTGWDYDDATKRWSGWYRYKYPPNLLKSLVWMAVESGAGGVLFQEWGPAGISDEVTGTAILKENKYANGSYQPDLLRLADMRESAGWQELGQVARDLAPYQYLLARTTLHGYNAARTNNTYVKVRTLTGRADSFRVLAVVNIKVGEYDEEELQIDPATGELKEFSPAGPTTFELTVKQDNGLIDMVTGRTLSPKKQDTKDRAGVYELELEPGEGRFYFRGSQTVFQRFIEEYKISIDRLRDDTGEK